ncbi:MAG: methyltransferase [Betaproteobacteria bacterium]|nr:MAG: methyltransferase [Betaproteobacteria bacterium]
MTHRARFSALQSLLASHEALWRPSPFHVPRPHWRLRWPALAAAVDTLDAAAVETLHADEAAARSWLTPRLPVLAELDALGAFAPLPARRLPPCDAHFDWAIPGRKRAQIEAFAAHGAPPAAPLLEWCAGKGHLGRRLALAHGVAVTSLEIDPELCVAGEILAARAEVCQTMLCADALAAGSQRHLRGREVVALHACGELHRSLVRNAGSSGAAGLRIAPCCYHLGADDGYRPLNAEAALPLHADTLRLAVTETVTAPQHARRRLMRDQVWKLGFVALRQALQPDDDGAPRPFRPVPAAWLKGEFADFCRALAQRENLPLPARVDWAYWQAQGERRRLEVRRHELVRHAFRRALEAWLVLDLALGLQQRGFDVEVGRFCPRTLTPRNLLLLARR